MAPIAVESNLSHPTSFVPVTKTLPHNVSTTLNYWLDPKDGSGPPSAYAGKPETFQVPTVAHSSVVHDIRGKEDQFTLDKNGFQIYRHVSKEKDFLDEERIKAEYLPETEQLLKDATGASRVFIFDFTIRGLNSNVDQPNTLRGPVQSVHVDQSYTAARSRVPHHLPEEADRLLKTRHQIINVWRPIKTILKDPFGVAEANSVPESDLVPRSLIYPNRNGETLTVKPNSDHQWYFLYGQTPEETLLVKCYDSKLDGRARRVPHSAFENEATKNESPRQSIEVRALVFHEDEPAE